MNSSGWARVAYMLLYLAATFAAADDDLKLRVVWWTAKSCQGVARLVGGVGLKAEAEFYRLCEEGRMN